MHQIPRFSLPERVAEYLREGIRQVRWSDRLPGVPRLAAELDVAQRTVRRAMQLLESEGLLSGRGLGRSRGITPAGAAGALARSLRVGILRHDARPTENSQTSLVLSEITHALEAAGHVVCLCKKSQVELKHDFRRMSSQLTNTRTDAWVIEAGSRELLDWSATRPVPCLALYGRTGGLALARTGPDKTPAYRAATRRLLELGHRRIVLVVRAARRLPSPGSCEGGFLEELAAHGIATGDYHLPDWEENSEGLSKLLNRLFQHSPPTALIIDEAAHYIGVAEFLARRRIHVPEQVSLVSTDDDAALAWCHPPVAHMRWDNVPIVRRVVRWVAAVRRGNPDRKISNVAAEFVPGGSIGPVCKG